MKIFLISLFLAVTSGLANAQESCPKVEIIGPAGLTTSGDIANFTVGGDLLKIEGLKFTWTVSSGTIESRQGEAALAVRTSPDTASSSITVSLEVSGLAAACADTAHETVGVAVGCALPPLIDQWERVSRNDERGRLDLVLANWEQRKDAVVMAVLYRAKGETKAAYDARVDRIKKHLIGYRKFPSDRLTILQAGFSDRPSTQFYLVPQADKDMVISAYFTSK